MTIKKIKPGIVVTWCLSTRPPRQFKHLWWINCYGLQPVNGWYNIYIDIKYHYKINAAVSHFPPNSFTIVLLPFRLGEVHLVAVKEAGKPELELRM